MIIIYLIHDLRALKACSLTCRSWYTPVLPHLHHTLTLVGNTRKIGRRELEPLSKLHELGLIPLVKEIRVNQKAGLLYWCEPQTFNPVDLGYFTTFMNVQALRLQNLDIHRFIPGIERYFEHLSPTLRSISLSCPRCTPRQLSHFLSLFSNLDDIEIQGCNAYIPTTTKPENLVPFSAPKLQGQLVVYNFSWVETWGHLIALSGGLRFRYMELGWSLGCTPVLFEACAKTLETLRFCATDGSISK